MPLSPLKRFRTHITFVSPESPPPPLLPHGCVHVLPSAGALQKSAGSAGFAGFSVSSGLMGFALPDTWRRTRGCVTLREITSLLLTMISPMNCMTLKFYCESGILSIDASIPGRSGSSPLNMTSATWLSISMSGAQSLTGGCEPGPSGVGSLSPCPGSCLRGWL